MSPTAEFSLAKVKQQEKRRWGAQGAGPRRSDVPTLCSSSQVWRRYLSRQDG